MMNNVFRIVEIFGKDREFLGWGMVEKGKCFANIIERICSVSCGWYWSESLLLCLKEIKRLVYFRIRFPLMSESFGPFFRQFQFSI